MKKCVKKVINYLKSEQQVAALEKTFQSEEAIKLILSETREFFDRDKVLPFFLYNYLTQNASIMLNSTNMFSRFSEYFQTIDYDEEVVTDFMLELVELYTQIPVPEKPKEGSEFADFYETYFLLEHEKSLGICFSEYINMEINPLNKVLENIAPTTRFIPYDLLLVIDYCKTIMKVRLDRKDQFDIDDINEVTLILFGLGVSSNLCNSIYRVLKRRNINLNEKEDINDRQVSTPLKVTETKPSKYLSDKEYRAMVKEIKKYYDLHSWKLIAEEITSEEREYVASLMVRIGVDQEQLANFLKKSEKVSKTYTYDYFKDHVEEFKFYFGEELNQVFEYMKEIEKCTDEEDKEYWIMGINEELTELQYSNKLASYEYERQLLKEKGKQDE